MPTAAWRKDLIDQGRNEEAKAIEVSFVPYDLRHTFGTRQATEVKTDPFTLAAIMGHSNLRTIMKYVHPDTSAQKAAMDRYVQAMDRARLVRVK